jgi:hypothetical protein
MGEGEREREEYRELEDEWVSHLEREKCVKKMEKQFP